MHFRESNNEIWYTKEDVEKLKICILDLQDDQNYLIKQAHVGHIIKPEWKNPTRGVQTKDVVKQYFSQLSKMQIKQLYEMFRSVVIHINIYTYA